MQVKHESQEFDWGMIVNFKRKEDKSRGRDNPLKSAPAQIVVDVLLHLADSPVGNNIKPCAPGETGIVEVVPVLHTLITHISSVRLKSPNDLRSSDSRKNILKTIQVIYFT